jgi:hypothetical protein
MPLQKSPKQTHQQKKNEHRANNNFKITHAMLADCSVDMKPHIKALGAMLEIMRAREGPKAESTPIWKLSELRFAKLQSAYDAMVKPRVESGSLEAIMTCNSPYATISFTMILVANSSETRMISERGTPVGCSFREAPERHRDAEERTDEERERIKYVAQDELQSQLVDTEAAADSSEPAVNRRDE